MEDSTPHKTAVAINQSTTYLSMLKDLFDNKNKQMEDTKTPKKNRLTDLAIKECKAAWINDGISFGLEDSEIKELDELIKLYENQPL